MVDDDFADDRFGLGFLVLVLLLVEDFFGDFVAGFFLVPAFTLAARFAEVALVVDDFFLPELDDFAALARAISASCSLQPTSRDRSHKNATATHVGEFVHNPMNFQFGHDRPHGRPPFIV